MSAILDVQCVLYCTCKARKQTQLAVECEYVSVIYKETVMFSAGTRVMCVTRHHLILTFDFEYNYILAFTCKLNIDNNTNTSGRAGQNVPVLVPVLVPVPLQGKRGRIQGDTPAGGGKWKRKRALNPAPTPPVLALALVRALAHASSSNHSASEYSCSCPYSPDCGARVESAELLERRATLTPHGSRARRKSPVAAAAAAVAAADDDDDVAAAVVAVVVAGGVGVLGAVDADAAASSGVVRVEGHSWGDGPLQIAGQTSECRPLSRRHIVPVPVLVPVLVPACTPFSDPDPCSAQELALVHDPPCLGEPRMESGRDRGRDPYPDPDGGTVASHD